MVLAKRLGRRRAGRALAGAAGTATAAVVLGAAGLKSAFLLAPIALTLGVVVAPIVAAWARARPPKETQALGPGLMDRLRLRQQTDKEETSSVITPLTLGVVVSPAAFGALVGLLVGIDAGSLGAALAEVGPWVLPGLLTMGVLTWREARRLLAPPEPGWWKLPTALRPLAAGTLLTALAFSLGPAFTFPAGLVAGLYVLGTASTFLVPSLWWLGRQVQRERRILAQVALPSHFEEGPEVKPWLVEVARSTEAPTAVRAEALAELARRYSTAEIGPTLDEHLANNEQSLVTMALRLSVQHRYRPPLKRLLEVGARPFAPPTEVGLRGVRRQPDPRALRFVRQVEEEALVHLCHLLRRYQDPRIEPLLIGLLAMPSVPILSAAAETLGLIGTLDSVEPLRQASVFGARFVAEEAIERIQIRRGGRGGALSLVDGENRGEISVVEEAGAVSLPKG